MANIKATTMITSLIKNNIHNVIYDYSREIKNLNDKINTLMNNTYTKAEVDNLIANLSVNPSPSIDLSNYYTISQVNDLLKDGMSDFTYSKKEIDNKVKSAATPLQVIQQVIASYTYTKNVIDQKLASISSGGTVDLSGYATTTQLSDLDSKYDSMLDNYVSSDELTGYDYLSKDDAAKTYATKEQTWGAKANVIGVFARNDNTLFLQDDCIPDFATEIHDGDTVDTMNNAIASYGAIKYFQVGCLTGSKDEWGYYTPEMYALSSFNLDGDYYLATDAYVDAKIDAIYTTDINTLKEYYTHNKQHYVTIEWDDKNDGFKNIPISDYSTEPLLTGTVEDGELLVRCAANYTLNFDFINNLAQTGGGEPYNFILDSDNYEIDSDSNAYPRFRLILSCKDNALAQVNYIIKKGWNLNGKYVAVDKTVAVNANQKVLLDVDLVLMNITVTTIDIIPSSRILTYTTTDNKIWTPSSVSWYESNDYGSDGGVIIIKDGVVNTTADMSKICNLSGNNLKTISIPNAVGMVGYGQRGMPLLTNCPNLTSVTLGNKLATMGYLFYNCPKLSEVYVKTGGTVFADSYKYLMSKDGKQLYWGVNADGIPSTVTTIMSGAFSYNQNNGNVVLQNNIVEIRDSAFYKNTMLTDFETGNAIKKIGASCFSGCTELTNMYIKASTPPTITSSTFSGLKEQLTIKVLNSAYNTYTSNGWEKYATIVSDTGTPEISMQDKMDVIQIVKDKKSTGGYVTYITSDQNKQSTDIRENPTSSALSESNHTFTTTPCKHGEFELPMLAEWPYTLFANDNKVTAMGIYAPSLSVNLYSLTFANTKNLKLLYINCASAWPWSDSPRMFGDNDEKIKDGTLIVYANQSFIDSAKLPAYGWPAEIYNKLKAL